MTMLSNSDLSRELCLPMLDLFGGADGGVAFAKLQHSFLPEMMEMQAAGNQHAAELMLMVTRMSVLCKTLLNKD